MPFVYKEVEVEIELDDFDDDELLEEIERRGIGVDLTNPEETRELVYRMYEKHRLGQNINEELRKFFWSSIGRSV